MSNFTPAWFKKGFFNESLFCDDFLSTHQLLYSNGAFFTPDGLPIAPELLTKWYRQWRSAHPEFEQIVFHGLRHSSATYQLLQSDGDFKSVQGNTGHAFPDGCSASMAGIQTTDAANIP